MKMVALVSVLVAATVVSPGLGLAGQGRAGAVVRVQRQTTTVQVRDGVQSVSAKNTAVRRKFAAVRSRRGRTASAAIRELRDAIDELEQEGERLADALDEWDHDRRETTAAALKKLLREVRAYRDTVQAIPKDTVVTKVLVSKLAAHEAKVALALEGIDEALGLSP